MHLKGPLPHRVAFHVVMQVNLKMHKCRVLILAATLLLPVTSLEAKDLGIFLGEPTPAYAMYTTQVNFAAAECASSVPGAKSKLVAKFTRHFNNLNEFARYRKKDPDFDAAVKRINQTYVEAWKISSNDQKTSFCKAFLEDAETYDSMGWMQRSHLMVFRAALSPLSEESRKRQKRIVNSLSLFAAAASATASVTAASDAVSAGNAGDWAASNQLMAESRELNQVGQAVSSLGTQPSRVPTFSIVIDLPDGTITSCPVTEHFSKHDEPQESAIWNTYQPVVVLCRDAAAPPIKQNDG